MKKPGGPLAIRYVFGDEKARIIDIPSSHVLTLVVLFRWK
jgi:hypothetical protein